MVDLAVLGLWLDSMCLRVFSALNDSMIKADTAFDSAGLHEAWGFPVSTA